MMRWVYSALAVVVAASLLAAAPCPAADQSPAGSGRPILPRLKGKVPPAGAAVSRPAPGEEAGNAGQGGLQVPGAGATMPDEPGAMPQDVSPAPGGAGTPPEKKTEAERFVSLNFDYADINVVIQTIAEILGMNYILSPGISGKVTIQTSGKVAVSDLFFVLEKILEVNNLTATKAGDFYKIIPIGSVGKEPMVIAGPDEKTPGEANAIQIFKLKQITPSEIVRLFSPLKSPQGIFIPQDQTGILFILDTGSRLKMFRELIESVDVDMYRDIQVELYPIANAQAEELAKDLTQVITAVATVPGRPATRFKLIPVKAINALLFVTSEPGLAGLVRRWIKELDQPATVESEKIFVYHLNHASAENVVGILRELYGGEKASTPVLPRAVQASADRARAARAGEGVEVAPPATTRTEAVIESAVSGKVKVVADKDTNSLIIQTAPWNYPSILETIKKLDLMPLQVLIEVTIAEITLDDSDTLGLEWSLLSGGSANVGGESMAFRGTASNVFHKAMAPTADIGFSYVLTQANRLTAVLNAYAKASKLNIISRPHILATNNKEAKIDVGQEVPIITSTQTSEEGRATTNTIEYRSTGVILTVTPHINENRDVSLDVQQEVSQAQENLLKATNSPIIQKRTAKTSMVVRDNETLIIGGLIQEKKDHTREGIPFLSRIPFLGYLFGTTIDTLSKTEMIIIITPRVITSSEEGTRITDEYRDKTIILKRGAESK